MLITQCKVLCRPANISLKSEGKERSSADKKDRLVYAKSSWKGSEIYRFSCSASQNFIPLPTMGADILYDFEPPSKKFLATPLTLVFTFPTSFSRNRPRDMPLMAPLEMSLIVNSAAVVSCVTFIKGLLERRILFRKSGYFKMSNIRLLITELKSWNSLTSLLV